MTQGREDVGFNVIKQRPKIKRETTVLLANIHPDSERKGNAFKSDKKKKGL